MARKTTYDQLRAKERALVEEINATNRARAALAAEDDRRGRPPSSSRFSRQARMTNKLARLRDQLAKVHAQMRDAKS